MAQAVKFNNSNTENLPKYVYSSYRLNLELAFRNEWSGWPGVIICGMGSSIESPEVKEHILNRYNQGFAICALKFTIKWLKEELNIQPHFTVQMDPGIHQCEKTPIDRKVIYYLASSCHPMFYRYLLSHGCKIKIFHSACGVQNEQYVYQLLFGNSDTMIGGFTVGNRAFSLCEYMGFPSPIEMAGFEFGWRDNENYYPSGVTNYKPIDNCFMTDNGLVDGKNWHTRPDLLASGISLVYMQKAGRVNVIGDSLVKSLSKYDDDYLEKVCQVKEQTEVDERG